MEGKPSYRKWCITGVNGHPNTSHKEEVWKIIRALKCLSKTPWLVLGEFNEILMWFEKWGGRDQSKNQIKTFRDMLANYALSDLEYSGDLFTWCNNRESLNRIMERLDRFLTNPQWEVLYPNGGVVLGHAAYSDHCPIWLDTNTSANAQHGPRSFRFETMWVGEEPCSKIIEDAWAPNER